MRERWEPRCDAGPAIYFSILRGRNGQAAIKCRIACAAEVLKKTTEIGETNPTVTRCDRDAIPKPRARVRRSPPEGLTAGRTPWTGSRLSRIREALSRCGENARNR